MARHHARRVADHPVGGDLAVEPTLERADESSRPSQHRAVDTLATMERRGSITTGMRQAGEDFRARFAVAQLDPLCALDLSRPKERGAARFRTADGPGSRIEGAREAVWRAILAAGGIGSPAGSCLWHVVGWEQSLKEWALERGWSGRRVSQEAASGILIAALGALEMHFGMKVIAILAFNNCQVRIDVVGIVEIGRAAARAPVGDRPFGGNSRRSTQDDLGQTASGDWRRRSLRNRP
jgi:hypothetical protein